MTAPKLLSPIALQVLAEISVTGIWRWFPDAVAALNDPQHTRVNLLTVRGLLRAGLLEESSNDAGHETLLVTAAGAALLARNPEAVGRANSTHDAQQYMYAVTGRSLQRHRAPSTVRP